MAGSSAPVPYFRLTFFVLVLIGIFLVCFRGQLSSEPPHLTPYICNTTADMIECSGLDDLETCADVPLPGGGDDDVTGPVDCIESACGREFAVGFDISVSGVSMPPDGPGPTAGKGNGTPTDSTARLMIFWGFVPYATGFVLILSFVYALDTSSLFFLLFMGVVGAVNEIVFKSIFGQSRPRGSCLFFGSNGMPSGHATTSVGTLLYATLEIWIDRPEIGLKRKAATFLTALFLLAPVPKSRTYLNDHTTAQVAAGSGEGIVVALLWFAFLYKFARSRLDRWIEKFDCLFGRIGFRNTYRNGVRFCPEWSPLCGGGGGGGGKGASGGEGAGDEVDEAAAAAAAGTATVEKGDEEKGGEEGDEDDDGGEETEFRDEFKASGDAGKAHAITQSGTVTSVRLEAA